MKEKRLYMTLFIVSIIFLGIGGTFAYLTVSVNATNITQVKAGNLTMTIDGGGNTNVSFMPAKCTSEYAIKKTIKASAKNTSGGKVSFSVGMNVAVLSDSLKRTTMKYALSTSATSCTDGLVANGNFKNATQGSDIWLIKNDYDDITNTSNTYTKTYYLYIWLDESETENISSGNISVNMKGTSSNNPNLTTEAVKSIPLYDYIKNNADTTTTIDFSKTSKASGTNGIYMTTDTDSGKPVYYYRGNVDNRVIFANFCWRIVRTTETGGVKMIYDGVPDSKLVYKTFVPIEQNQYSVTNDENYPFVYDSSKKTWKSNTLVGVEEGANGIESYIDLSGFESDSYQLEINMKGNTTNNGSAVMVNEDIKWISGETDTNVISLDLTSSDTVTVAYLKRTASTDGSDYIEFSIKKGSGDAQKVWPFCNNTGSNSTIGSSEFNKGYDNAKYVGYMYGSSIDDTANTNDSTIKTAIDTWYKTNMTSYTSQLEDTVFCNDRSYTSGSTLKFGAYTRLNTNPTPTLKCQNTKDKFTVDASNGNGALTYPVGLITADEMAYAGGKVYDGSADANNSFYLYTGKLYWTLSPYSFYNSVASGFRLSDVGRLSDEFVDHSYGVRPSVSLQPGIAKTGGSGTAADPFVIG